MKRALTAGLVCLALIAAVYAGLTFQKLHEELDTQKQRSASLSTEVGQRTQELERVRSQAEAAREQAERASREAESNSTAAQVAEEQKRQAEEARSLAEQSTREAETRESLARTELAELRERRQHELDRMQEALSRIAPTRRTASGMVVELANDSFQFDFDKAALRLENREILSRIAGVLLASHGYRLFVYGHTDDIGPADYNQKLSFRRASSVADYLKQAGVPDEVMKVQGFGKSSPRMNNDTAGARQKNRRVEIGIVDSTIEYEGLAPAA